ncbi:radial spoke head 1 homolog [Hydractinia symbiolongicarpus]|uniref:radial spoke head 1 homolog n=1 Tax=Hydractinia symbiolongicarpus TaxID=13093 RepID=UPI00255054AF|nr:radial spoke head 1 homolog [Hydractinia symbiolongicarpus]
MSDDSDYELEGFGDTENDIGVYDGDRNADGARHGHGKACFPNGDIYEGEYEDGKRNGCGSYKFKAAKYVGKYSNGKRQGDGQMYYPDGSTYNGQWNDGDKNGVGVYTYPNGDVYEGEWKDDQKHGKGVYTYKSTGTQFKGHWSQGVREGHAEWINNDHSYKGYFRNDQPFGRGYFLFNNGCEQHGYFKVTNFVEKVDKVMELVGRETQWTSTALVPSPPKTLPKKDK